MNKKILTLLSLTVFLKVITTQTIANISMVEGITKTNSIFWNNYVGLNLYLDQISTYLTNTTLLQYIANSNSYSDVNNKWSAHIEVPLGYKHNCTSFDTLQTQPLFQCTKQISKDQPFLKEIAYFASNTSNPPFWTMGFDYQYYDPSNQEQASVFYQYVKQIADIVQSGNCYQMVNNADKAVQLHYKKDSFTPQMFLEQMKEIQFQLYGLVYEGPGITQDAGQDWLKTVLQLQTYCRNCVWSAQAIIFKNIADCTINNLLSETYTRESLKNRFTRGAYSITNFEGKGNVRLSKVKLTADNGVENVTNTLAAAFWQLDYILEFALMYTWDINIDSQIKAGNFQHVFTPDMKPGALYYGMLFASILGNQSPTIVLPQVTPGSSSSIKAWAFETIQSVKILAINKDMNQGLNGVLNLQMNTQQIKCIYLEAPNLNSTSGITIAGINFDTSPKGTGQFKQTIINSTNNKFSVNFKYAQAVLCEGKLSNKAFPVGVKTSSTVSQYHLTLSCILLLIMMFVIII